MDFIGTLPPLAVFNEELPYPNTLAEAYWLAELARLCHARLKAEAENPAGFWTLLNTDEANRVYGSLKDASNGVSEAANALLILFKDEPAPASIEELYWPLCIETVEAFNSIAETVTLEYPEHPALIAEVQALATQWQQKLIAAQEVA